MQTNPTFFIKGRVVFIRYRTNAGQPGILVIHNNLTNRIAF
jgi:hypothetical protein